MLNNILSKYKFFFDRTLVTWKNEPVDKELQIDAKTNH